VKKLLWAIFQVIKMYPDTPNVAYGPSKEEIL